MGACSTSCACSTPGLEVVVVSDGSTDRTAEVAAAGGAHVVRLPFNIGIGGAVQTGFLFRDGTGLQSSRSGSTATAGAARSRRARGCRAPRRLRRGRHRDSARVFSWRAVIAPRRRAGSVSGCSRARRLRRSRGATPHRHHLGLFRRSTARRLRLSCRRSCRIDYPEVEGSRDGDPARAARDRGFPSSTQCVSASTAAPPRSGAPRLQLCHYMVKVLLAIFIDLLPQGGRDGGGRMTPVRISIAAIRPSSRSFCCSSSSSFIRSRRLRERYALLWLSRRESCADSSSQGLAGRLEHDRALARRAQAITLDRRCCSRSVCSS